MLRMQVCEKAYMRYLEWVRMLGDDCSDSPSVATFGMLGALLHPRFITRVVPVGIGSLLCRVLDKHLGRSSNRRRPGDRGHTPLNATKHVSLSWLPKAPPP
jgi:hypothetical protein